MPAPRDMIAAATERGYFSETPREKQIRELVEREGEDLDRARRDLHRMRRREAKCKLVGHRDTQVDENTNECLRCGRLEDV